MAAFRPAAVLGHGVPLVHNLLSRTRIRVADLDLGCIKLVESAAFWSAGYGVVALVDVAAELFALDRLSWASLFLAMPSLAATVLAGGPLETSSSLVVAALLFSWLGDWVGDLSTGVLIKLLLFLGAQICYVAAFWPFRSGSVL